MITQQPSRPLCKECGTSLAKPNGISKHGFQKWHKYCIDCAKAAYSPRFKYLTQKKSKCEICGFAAKDKCQLDVIYKDGNRKNTEKSNIKTVCANCNRLHQKKSKAKRKSILNTITVDADVRI